MHTLLPVFGFVAVLSVIIVATGPYWYPVWERINDAI